MKKKSIYIFIISAAGVFSACSDSWDDKYSMEPFDLVVAPSLAVNQEKMEFPCEESNQTLEIIANGRWTASTSASWLKLSQSHGRGNTSLNISVEAYTNTTQDRSATITISNGITTRQVSVTQLAMIESLQTSLGEWTVSYEGGNKVVEVRSNVPWTISSSASWLTFTKDSKGLSFTISVQKYINTTPREAKITIKGVKLIKEVIVSQSGVQAPVIGKLSVSNVSKHEATCNFQASSNDIDIKEYGVCYSNSNKTPSKTNADVKYQQGGGKNVTKSFKLTDLKSKTTYYVCPYVVTDLGTQYGETIQFTTPASVPNEDDNGKPKD